ncbi:ribosome maturation factor RimM [Arthrobacter sp. 260]|uniref:ribosome maturation factor RimM n=1 Tax=Arthrobacter sp. 260 TaxID=2735314 RepID=UPI001490C2ED|nr:ribosome maturation factor RimM [Arthrobacter sp. 260]NOJ60342.1 ribosome maturation factor RimM [Arthrobacter sp. 260]
MEVQVARIGKPHGIRGEVTVQLFTDAPEDRFEAGSVFRAEPATLGSLTVSGARWNKDILILGFDGFSDRNAAETLRGAKLFIDTDEADDDDDDAWYEHELVGLEARVGDDIVGKVSGLRTLEVQDLLIIETSAGHETLVPFVAEIVPEVNVADGFVLLTPPDGLFELNLPGSNQAGPDDGEVTELDDDAPTGPAVTDDADSTPDSDPEGSGR